MARYTVIETKGCQYGFAVLDLHLNLIPHRSSDRSSAEATSARLNAAA